MKKTLVYHNVRIEDQLVGILTKVISGDSFNRILGKLGIRNPMT